MRMLGALLLCCAAPALFAAAPTRIEATYDVTTKGIKIAEVSEKFTRSGEHYRIESVTRPVGLLAMFKPDTIHVVSEGDITAEGLRPHSYVHRRSKDAHRNTGADFDWQRSTLTLSDRHGQRHEPLAAGTQDRLSALYQFRYLQLLRERKEVAMHITDGSKIDVRQYLVRPEQALTVPFGTLQALYLATPPQKTAWKTELWLAPEHGNFPCKVVLTEDNGDQLSQLLTTLSITQ